MPDSIESTADAIWSLIQRPSPAVTRDEIMSVLRVAMDAPTASEEVLEAGTIILPAVYLDTTAPETLAQFYTSLAGQAFVKATKAPTADENLTPEKTRAQLYTDLACYGQALGKITGDGRFYTIDAQDYLDANVLTKAPTADATMLPAVYLDTTTDDLPPSITHGRCV
jgi:hypothetical protein